MGGWETGTDMLLTSSESRSGKPLNIAQCRAQSPTTKNHPDENVHNPPAEKPYRKERIRWACKDEYTSLFTSINVYNFVQPTKWDWLNKL